MLRCDHGTFEVLVRAVGLVLTEIIVRGGNATLPRLDLDHYGNAFVYNQKVLFEIPVVAPRNNDVSDHAIKVVLQKTVDSLFSAGTVGMNVVLFGERQGGQPTRYTAKKRFGHGFSLL